MTFKRILCPTDFSSGSEHALRFATTLAMQHASDLIVLHSWYLPASPFSLGSPIPAAVTQQIVADSQKRLDATVERARKAGVKHVVGELVGGIPWVEITQMLDSRGADLCVLGTHGRTGIKRVLLGSVAEKVVRHAHCSVLAVPSDSEPIGFHHVLVPTDFSACAERAATLAASLVGSHGVLKLMYCLELPVTYETPMPVPLEYDASATALLTEEATRLKRATTARVETLHRVGAPGAEILRTIDENPTIDLVVMGSRGRTGLKRALLGSVAEKTVRHAGRPVLVARGERE